MNNPRSWISLYPHARIIKRNKCSEAFLTGSDGHYSRPTNLQFSSLTSLRDDRSVRASRINGKGSGGFVRITDQNRRFPRDFVANREHGTETPLSPFPRQDCRPEGPRKPVPGTLRVSSTLPNIPVYTSRRDGSLLSKSARSRCPKNGPSLAALIFSSEMRAGMRGTRQNEILGQIVIVRHSFIAFIRFLQL